MNIKNIKERLQAINVTKEQWQQIISVLLSAAIAIAAIIGWDIGVKPLVFPFQPSMVSRGLGVQRFNQAVQFLMPETHSGTETHSGSVTFSGSTTLGSVTQAGALNMGNYVINNIGNPGTDFNERGGLQVADGITVTKQISVAGGASVNSGLTIVGGGLTVSSGGVTVSSGDTNLSNGTLSNIGNAGTDFNERGGLTSAEGISATFAAIGGGYGSSGCSFGSDGVLQCNGLATLAGGADMNATTLVNIGNPNTDFNERGGLVIAEGITVTNRITQAGQYVGKVISGTVANNGTIAHGLSAAPSMAVCSPYATAVFTFTVYVSGTMGATNINIGIADPINSLPAAGSYAVSCYVIP